MAQTVDMVPGTREYKTHMHKQSSAGKKDGLHCRQNKNKLY